MQFKKLKFLRLCLSVIITFICVDINAKVEFGIDQVMHPKYFKFISGKRVGLVTNRNALNNKGQETLSLFLKHKKINVTAIFTPEDGLLGSDLDSKQINKYKIPVYSLYSPHKLVPIKKQVDKVDVFVFDLQSVGVRYYTFITTLGQIMQQAKKYSKTVVVLDRPNPLNGLVVAGPMTAKKYYGRYIAYYPLPMNYALTIGELGKYYKNHFIKGVDYHVVPLKNWKRSMLFADTGLKWVPPTSALPTLEQVYIYSFLGPLEGANLSVGRGLEHKQVFKYYGAPFISESTAKKMVKELNASKLPGLKFSESNWTPGGKKGVIDPNPFIGYECHGFKIDVTNFKKVDRFKSLVTVLKVLEKYTGDKSKLINTALWIGAPWVIDEIKKGTSVSNILNKVNKETNQYRRNFKKSWLYH